MDDLLQQGITAYKAGKRDEARNIFISILKQNPDNERAWGWMYNVSSSNKERIYCLQQMLRINPKNEKASTLLKQLVNEPSLKTPSNVIPTKSTQPPKAGLKKCPYCAEEIQDDAIVCRYCGRVLPNPVTPSRAPTQSIPKQAEKKSVIPRFIVNGLIVTAGVISCILFFWMIAQFNPSQSSAGPTSSPQVSAWTACTIFVEKQLGLSTREAQRYTPSGVTTLPDNRFRVEVYYADPGNFYRCEILHHSDGNWELLKLKVK